MSSNMRSVPDLAISQLIISVSVHAYRLHFRRKTSSAVARQKCLDNSIYGRYGAWWNSQSRKNPTDGTVRWCHHRVRAWHYTVATHFSGQGENVWSLPSTNHFINYMYMLLNTTYHTRTRHFNVLFQIWVNRLPHHSKGCLSGFWWVGCSSSHPTNSVKALKD